MNGEDKKYLEKLFEQHKEDQQLYLDAKFGTVEEKINDCQSKMEDIKNGMQDAEKKCLKCRSCIDNKIKESEQELRASTTKKVITGSVIAVITTITLWAAFGQDIVKVILGRLF